MRVLTSLALVITVASAIMFEPSYLELHRTGLKNTNLPRAVVHTAPEDGCGYNLTGYLLIGQGMLWTDHTPGYASSPTACRERCDSSKECIAFTARYPKKGKMQCDIYKGLVKHYDPRSSAYSKCPTSYKCPDGAHFAGFQFSHKGSWKDGVKGKGKTLEECSSVCKLDRSCVGFALHLNKAGKHNCFYFNNAANEAGPQRDARANTYSKCIDLVDLWASGKEASELASELEASEEPEPEAPKPQVSETEAPGPEAPKPQASEPEEPEPQASEPQASEEEEANKPQALEPQAPEPEAPQPKAPEPQASQPEAPQPQASESEAPGDEDQKPQVSEPETPEPQASEPQAQAKPVATAEDKAADRAKHVANIKRISSAMQALPDGDPAFASARAALLEQLITETKAMAELDRSA